jgi:hypothetical protein
MSQQSGRAWELAEVTIPLGLPLNDVPVDEATKQCVQSLIESYLQAARREGWTPLSPRDWDALWREGRIEVRVRTAWLGLIGQAEIAAAVVRLGRPVPTSAIAV